MHTIQNGVLHNGQQALSVGNGFIDQDEIEVMKTLSGRGALCCDKHLLCSKLSESW